MYMTKLLSERHRAHLHPAIPAGFPIASIPLAHLEIEERPQVNSRHLRLVSPTLLALAKCCR